MSISETETEKRLELFKTLLASPSMDCEPLKKIVHLTVNMQKNKTQAKQRKIISYSSIV